MVQNFPDTQVIDKYAAIMKIKGQLFSRASLPNPVVSELSPVRNIFSKLNFNIIFTYTLRLSKFILDIRLSKQNPIQFLVSLRMSDTLAAYLSLTN